MTLNTGHYEIIDVPADFKFSPLDGDEWVEIDTAGGGRYIVPTRLVVSIVVEDG